VFPPGLGGWPGPLAGAGLCTTAVGPGAALALADADGEVERYRGLDAVRSAPDEVFSCPVTVVDAGSAPYARDPGETRRGRIPVPPDATSEGPERTSALQRIDDQVRHVLDAVPDGSTVIVIDVGNPAVNVIPGRATAAFNVRFRRPEGSQALEWYTTALLTALTNKNCDTMAQAVPRAPIAALSGRRMIRSKDGLHRPVHPPTRDGMVSPLVLPKVVCGILQNDVYTTVAVAVFEKVFHHRIVFVRLLLVAHPSFGDDTAQIAHRSDQLLLNGLL
jgi:antitoxin (DNA-binding transcriptional repressor) of toxin-antitoxin stability system